MSQKLQKNPIISEAVGARRRRQHRRRHAVEQDIPLALAVCLRPLEVLGKAILWDRLNGSFLWDTLLGSLYVMLNPGFTQAFSGKILT